MQIHLVNSQHLSTKCYISFKLWKIKNGGEIVNGGQEIQELQKGLKLSLAITAPLPTFNNLFITPEKYVMII